MPVAVAAPNTTAASAGRQVADAGGNAVDVAVASAVAAMVTEPGICSLAGGAYVTVQPIDGSPETIDAYVSMPGHGLPAERFGHGTFDIHTAYGGGVDVTIGHGSVATPGTPAGLALAHRRHGRLPWAALLEPGMHAARDGFPMGAASSYYLAYVHEDLYGWDPRSYAALHDRDGRLIPEGGTVRLPELAATLAQLAAEGPDAFYRGEVGARIVDEIQAHDGLLTRADLERYEALVRTPVTATLGDWTVATNPPPAIGGVTLAAMLRLMGRPGAAGGVPPAPWTPDTVARLVAVQDAVLARRVTDLDLADDRDGAARELLRRVEAGAFTAALASPSTIHVSAAGSDGQACAITASTGYGSGVMPAGTGLWLNNCLGEPELNRNGLHAWRTGERLPSNMAPTVARHVDGAALAIGSPGADRITTAILQALLRFAGGATLAEAIAAPRLHVRHHPDGTLREVGHEADLPLPALGLPVRTDPPRAMFFGGVAAALRRGDGTLDAAADPRREGATAIGG